MKNATAMSHSWKLIWGVVCLSAMLAWSGAYAQDMRNAEDEKDVEMFAHPFLNHMGIADMPGMTSVRATGYRQGYTGEPSLQDAAFHLEAGLFGRLGIHVRNDAIKQIPRTDLMFMYNVLLDRSRSSGISLFAAGEVPSGTVPSGEDKVVAAVGIGGREVIGDVSVVDGNVHYMPAEGMYEYGLSVVFRATSSLFPIMEVQGEANTHETSAYVLPALKFKLVPGTFIGVGSQVALTSTREFDNRMMLQLDKDW